MANQKRAVFNMKPCWVAGLSVFLGAASPWHPHAQSGRVIEREQETERERGKACGKAEFCAEHASDEMVDISEKCGHNGGNRPSSYGKDGGKAELCAEHAADSIWWMPAARDVTIAGASSARSTARPVGRWGSALTMPQTAWRASSARDVAQGVRASSDHHTARLVAELCAEHAEYGMLDVRNPVCDHSLCAKQPSYGEAGAERAKGQHGE